jgi:hypothetical protein
MGGSSSSHQVASVNQEETNVVTISEDVARRLLGRSEVTDDHAVATPAQAQKRVTYRPQVSTSQDDLDFVEGHYVRRVRALERQNNLLQQTNDDAFVAAVKDVEAKFLKHHFSEPVCCDLQQAVEKCYVNNPGSTLACVEQVKAFKECVQKHRQAMLSSKG